MRKSELISNIRAIIILLALGGINPDVYSTDTEISIDVERI